jgi:hypothetical protein
VPERTRARGDAPAAGGSEIGKGPFDVHDQGASGELFSALGSGTA